MKYEFIDLDVWGNAREGWEVNSAYHTGNYVYLEDNELDRKRVLKACKLAGMITSISPFILDDVICSENTIYVSYKNGKPAFELEAMR